MTSRLFHAVVGLGISLGAAGAACSGGSEEPSDPADATALDTSSGETASPFDSSSDTDQHADAELDAATLPKDVMLDAFCDAAWPTTKGNTGGPTCGPIEDCSDAGPAPHCYKVIGPSVCDPGNTATTGAAAYCVDKTWKCSSGSVTYDECKCWGLPDGGQNCPIP